uniref:Secreted protein n=1 Tax=Engystomops pustulosus TaxID=76066 RepID=A0AAV6YVC4_ENGPU|nr:hypothetical protein GDO81_021352 [Engystomops pustulosus]
MASLFPSPYLACCSSYSACCLALIIIDMASEGLELSLNARPSSITGLSARCCRALMASPRAPDAAALCGRESVRTKKTPEKLNYDLSFLMLHLQ